MGNTQTEAPNNIFPSLRLEWSQPPRPLLFLRRGTYPPPVPLPTSGGGSTAPTRRSDTKVPSTHQRVVVFFYATELRFLIGLCPPNRNRSYGTIYYMIVQGEDNTNKSDYPHLSASDSPKRQEGGVAVGVDFMSIRSPLRAKSAKGRLLQRPSWRMVHRLECFYIAVRLKYAIICSANHKSCRLRREPTVVIRAPHKRIAE